MVKTLQQRVMDEVLKPEPPNKRWEYNEASLLSTFRKLTEEQRIEVLCYTQNLAIARIRTRLEKSDARKAL